MTFEAIEDGCYESGGVVYNEIGRPLSKERCDHLLIPWTEAQASAYDAYITKIIGDYRKSRANRSPEAIAEQRAEARAAMGPGVQMIDVVTGEMYTT